MVSFFLALGFLFLAIAANTALTPKPQNQETPTAIRDVRTYTIGSAPTASFLAKIDKKGVIQIVAQAPGIVSQVNVFEGQNVWRGTSLVSLSSNYQGGNAQSVGRQLAFAQYKNVKDTYYTQKDLINKQREVANVSSENADRLREITDQSLSDTRGLVDLNDDIIETLEANLEATEASGDPNQILQARQLLLQARSANSQLNQGLKQAEFAASGDNPPAKLADLQKDIALKQLDIQEKALNLGRESSKLQLALAQIAESAMFPAAPFDAVVQKVHVSPGQAVNPGTPLVTIAGVSRNAIATVTVPKNVVNKVSKLDESKFTINGKSFSLWPEFVSSEATDGQLNSVTFALTDDMYDLVNDGQYIKVEIPIGHADTIGTIPYVPIDIVFQTQEGAFVYIVQDGKVKSRKVTLGDLLGSNVAVASGLSGNFQVILDRNVIEGERVRVQN